MGAEHWQYFVPYREDINAALQDLREQEFQAGRYRGGEESPHSIYWWDDNGDFEDSDVEEIMSIQDRIAQVFQDSSPDGTRSILDIFQVSKIPTNCAISPLSRHDLLRFFNSDKPTHATVETVLSENVLFWSSINRGQGRYIMVYQNNKPMEICFVGYSFD